MSLENIHPIETAKAHPYIVAGIVAVILLYFFWPSSTSQTTAGSNVTAQEEAAIAAASQSNASLTASTDQMNTDIAIAGDQVQVTGLNDATSQAINAANTSAAVTINGQNTSYGMNVAGIAGQVATLNSNNNLTAIENTNNEQGNLATIAAGAQAEADSSALQLQNMNNELAGLAIGAGQNLIFQGGAAGITVPALNLPGFTSSAAGVPSTPNSQIVTQGNVAVQTGAAPAG